MNLGAAREVSRELLADAAEGRVLGRWPGSDKTEKPSSEPVERGLANATTRATWNAAVDASLPVGREGGLSGPQGLPKIFVGGLWQECPPMGRLSALAGIGSPGRRPAEPPGQPKASIAPNSRIGLGASGAEHPAKVTVHSGGAAASGWAEAVSEPWISEPASKRMPRQ